MNNYLIPANTKKGMLILGIFRTFDLIMFGIGCAVSLLLLVFFPMTDTVMVVLVLSPALVTGFLVVPIPYYHNLLTVLGELYEFLTSRQKFYWRGWCVRDGINEPKEKYKATAK